MHGVLQLLAGLAGLGDSVVTPAALWAVRIQAALLGRPCLGLSTNPIPRATPCNCQSPWIPTVLSAPCIISPVALLIFLAQRFAQGPWCTTVSTHPTCLAAGRPDLALGRMRRISLAGRHAKQVASSRACRFWPAACRDATAVAGVTSLAPLYYRCRSLAAGYFDPTFCRYLPAQTTPAPLPCVFRSAANHHLRVTL